MKRPSTFSTFFCFLLAFFCFFSAPTSSQTTTPDPHVGRWMLTIEDDARRIEMPADLRIEANGQVKLVLLGRTGGEDGLFTGALAGSQLIVRGRILRGPAEITLTVSGDRMMGRVTGDLIRAEINATYLPGAGAELPVKRFDGVAGAVLDSVKQHFYDPRLNGVDLNALGARHMPRVKAARNDGDLALAIRRMLAELRASHLEFFHAGDKPQIVDKNEPVLWRQIEPGIGYLAILNFPSKSLRHFDGLLSMAMSELASAPRLVIDLRGNRGERLEAALIGLNIILPEGRPVAYIVSREAMGRMNIPSIDSLDPSTLLAAFAGDNLATAKFQGAGMYLAGGKFKTPYRGRIALLVDEGCAGSCELFAAAMKEARAATLIGRRTRGSLLLSMPVNFKVIGWMGFPRSQVQGWQLEVPTTEVRTAGGARIEGRGVEPDIVVERLTTDDAELARALEWLNGKS